MMEFRMSAAGKCMRALTAAHLGMKPIDRQPWQEAILRESIRHEGWVLDDLLAEGWQLRNYGDQQAEYRWPFGGHVLVGHTDALRSDPEQVVEIKALGRFTFQRFRTKGLGAHRQYEYQLACYMAVAEKPGMLVVKCRDTGQKLYTEVAEPPVPFTHILQRLEWVAECVGKSELPECEFEPGSEDCRWCDYPYLCAGAVQAVPEAQELAAMAILWREGMEYEAMARERVEQARERFRAYLKASNLSEAQAEGVRFTLASRERKGWDEKVLARLLTTGQVAEARKMTTYEELRVHDDRPGN